MSAVELTGVLAVVAAAPLMPLVKCQGQKAGSSA